MKLLSCKCVALICPISFCPQRNDAELLHRTLLTLVPYFDDVSISVIDGHFLENSRVICGTKWVEYQPFLLVLTRL